ncbi:MAG: hypothetical protein ACRD4I_02575, partial [Candidatus Angelobacter sp.]
TVFGLNVAQEPEGPLALPGSYQVRLTVDGATYTRPLKLVMDPRVLVPKTDLEAQFALQIKIYRALVQASRALDEIAAYRLTPSASQPEKLKAIQEIEPAGERTTAASKTSLSSMRGALAQITVELDSADAAPTSQETAAAEKSLADLMQLLSEWGAIKK